MISNLKKIRLEQGLTMTALAEMSGVSVSAISLLELRNNPRLSTAYKIATALGLSVYDVWPNEDKPI